MIEAATNAVKFCLSELGRENIVPDIDMTDPLPFLEAELVPMCAMYLGEWVAEEAKRLFINESLEA